MVTVGVHVSIAGGISKAVGRAAAAGCDTFQIFSRNPRGWIYRDLEPADVVLFRQELENSRLSPAVDHMPYLPNLATMNPDFEEKSRKTLIAELSRCGTLGIPYLVTHLGHYGQEGKEAGQGVGYLDDGTMIVVEDGGEHIGSVIPVTVTRVLQTVAGRMNFALPDGARDGAATAPRPPRERPAQ